MSYPLTQLGSGGKSVPLDTSLAPENLLFVKTLSLIRPPKQPSTTILLPQPSKNMIASAISPGKKLLNAPHAWTKYTTTLAPPADCPTIQSHPIIHTEPPVPLKS